MVLPVLSPENLYWFRVAYDLRERRGTAKATINTSLGTTEKLKAADVTAIMAGIRA